MQIVCPCGLHYGGTRYVQQLPFPFPYHISCRIYLYFVVHPTQWGCGVLTLFVRLDYPGCAPGGATTNGPDATTPPSYLSKLGGGGGGGGGGQLGGGSSRGSGGGVFVPGVGGGVFLPGVGGASGRGVRGASSPG